MFCICRSSHTLGLREFDEGESLVIHGPERPCEVIYGGCLSSMGFLNGNIVVFIYIYIDSQADWLFTKQIGFEKNRERGNCCIELDRSNQIIWVWVMSPRQTFNSLGTLQSWTLAHSHVDWTMARKWMEMNGYFVLISIDCVKMIQNIASLSAETW